MGRSLQFIGFLFVLWIAVVTLFCIGNAVWLVYGASAIGYAVLLMILAIMAWAFSGDSKKEV